MARYPRDSHSHVLQRIARHDHQRTGTRSEHRRRFVADIACDDIRNGPVRDPDAADRIRVFIGRAGQDQCLFQQRSGHRQDSRRGGADPAPWPSGVFQELRCARCRDQAPDVAGYDLPRFLDVEADHGRRCHDADRPGPAQARRSALEIHSRVRRRQSRRRGEGGRRRAEARSRRAGPAHHHPGHAAAVVRHHLRFLWR